MVCYVMTIIYGIIIKGQRETLPWKVVSQTLSNMCLINIRLSIMIEGFTVMKAFIPDLVLEQCQWTISSIACTSRIILLVKENTLFTKTIRNKIYKNDIITIIEIIMIITTYIYDLWRLQVINIEQAIPTWNMYVKDKLFNI